jgi:predicted outer membrane repeat protein
MTQTKFKLNRKALFGLMVLAAAGAMPVQAATITVDPIALDEAVDTDAKCSLREAVLSINTGGNTGACVAVVTEAYGTNDTVTLPAGTYNLSVTGFDESWSGIAPNFTADNVPSAAIGDIDIIKSVRLVGAGADATIIQWGAAIADADRDRIFHIYTTAVATVNVAIEGVTITGGRTFQDFIAFGADDLASPVVQATEYYLRRAGGGVAVGAAANVVLIDPALVGDENAAGRGGSQRPGVPGVPGPTFGLTLTGVKVQDNQAQGDGAGIYAGAPMTATNVVVSGNTSTVNGGGIYNEGDTSVTNSTISGNKAEGGGGVFLTGTNTVTVSGTALSGNRAIGGGAVSGRSGVTINMVNSTLSGNLGDDVGAGFYHQGAASLRFVTIANNISGADAPTAGSGINVFPSGAVAVALKNVLLAANKVGWDSTVEPNGPADPAALASANCGYTGSSMAITSSGNNLSSDASCTTLNLATDKNNVDPKIGALANNGGLTLTHALLADSPALSAGASDAAVTTDQRGQPRESPPDIGAFELDNITESTSSGGGGGCAVGVDGQVDPVLPALLAAALTFFGWRRRTAR